MTETRRRWTLVAVALATFMTYLDNNIVNVAMPAIQRDLHLSVSGLEWVVSGYILTFAGLLLTGGRLADRFGRRRLFLIGLTVFTASSLAAGLVGSVGPLIASRAIQGVGAAMLTPTTLAIITATFTDTKARNAAIGLWSAVGALALAVGPLLGGVLSQHVSWEWIFLVNVPVGIVTLGLGAWAIPESKESTARGLDAPGLVTSAVALFALTYALIEGHAKGWGSGIIVASFVVAAVFAAAFLAIESRTAQPMVSLSLFRERVFTGGLVSLMMWAFGLFGIYFFTSLYLQNVLGFSATKAGAAFVPMALLMAAGAIASERLAAAFGPKILVTVAMVMMGAGVASLTLLGEHVPFWQLMPSFAIVGIGGGLTIPLTAAVIAVMPTEEAGMASALFNSSREVAGLLGLTVIGAVLTTRQSASTHAGHAPLQAFLSGYRWGLLVAAALIGLGALAAWVALPGRAQILEAEELFPADQQPELVAL